MEADELVHVFLLLVLLPAWLAVGLGDWWCHRKAHIEYNAGAKESVVHLLLSAQAAVAVLAGLLFDINTLILAIMIAMFVLHEATTNLDLRFAYPARPFTKTELRIHDFLTAIPFAALCLVIATHMDAAFEMDFDLRWKDPPLPAAYLTGWIAASFGLNVLPYTEELMRCLKVASRNVR